MGIDTEGHINRSIEAEDIMDTLESMGATNPEIVMGACSSHFIILFDHEFINKKYQRMMHFHYGLGLFGGHKITLGMDEQAKEIIEDIVHRFGGVFVPNDCEEGNATVYDNSNAMLNNSDSVFLLKWAIARGYIHDSSTGSVAIAKEKFEEYLNRNR